MTRTDQHTTIEIEKCTFVSDPAARIAELEEALRRAAPYVVAFAENAPHDDGGEEAKIDLLHIRAALPSAPEK